MCYGWVKNMVSIFASVLISASLFGQTSFKDNYHPLTHGDTMYRVEVYSHLKSRWNFLCDSLCKHSNKEKKPSINSVLTKGYLTTNLSWKTTTIYGAIVLRST